MDKSFPKKFFLGKGKLYFEISLVSFIHKIFEQTFYLYTTVYLVRIWTYKNADKKAHTFSRRSKNVKKNGRKRTKKGYCENSPLVFNCQKSFDVVFLPPKFQLFGCPALTLNQTKIRFVDSVKYIWVYLSSTLNDDDDIAKKVRYMYCCANMLKYRFYRGSRIVKNNLFRSLLYFALLKSTKV